jgi:hypothetical protein
MTPPRDPGGRARRGPSRYELPEIDAAALDAARWADRALAAVRELGVARWTSLLEPLPERLRDADADELQKVATHARSFFGAKDSVADVLPVEVSAGLRDAIDRLRRDLARHSAHSNRG